jgi:hypothetical protein
LVLRQQLVKPDLVGILERVAIGEQQPEAPFDGLLSMRLPASPSSRPSSVLLVPVVKRLKSWS